MHTIWLSFSKQSTSGSPSTLLPHFSALKTSLCEADNLKSFATAWRLIFPSNKPGVHPWVRQQGAGREASREGAILSVAAVREKGGKGRKKEEEEGGRGRRKRREEEEGGRKRLCRTCTGLTERWKSRKVLPLLVPVGPTLIQPMCYSLHFYPVWGISGIQDTQ